jgi:CheY-like chemotaxis protein
VNRVLVVEDTAAVRQMYASALSSSGFEVDEAGNVDEAMQRIARRHPHAILIDIVLPMSSGLELMEMLQSSPATAGIPIVGISAYDVDEVRILLAGCTAFLKKPASPEVLVTTMRQAIAG